MARKVPKWKLEQMRREEQAIEAAQRRAEAGDQPQQPAAQQPGEQYPPVDHSAVQGPEQQYPPVYPTPRMAPRAELQGPPQPTRCPHCGGWNVETRLENQVAKWLWVILIVFFCVAWPAIFILPFLKKKQHYWCPDCNMRWTAEVG